MRLAGALLLVASAAAAEPDAAPLQPQLTDARFSFTWSAPPPCPARDEVLARAERLVGHPLTRASGAQPVVLAGTVRALAAAAWQLHAESGAAGESERLVTAGSCDELADAMALFIALSIDPEYAARSGSPAVAHGRATFADAPAPPAPPASAAPAPAPPPSVLRSPAPPHTDRAREPFARDATRSGAPVRSAVGALGALWVGRLPGVAPGGLLRGALSRKAWVFAVELGYFPAQHAVKESVGGDLSLATLGGSFGYALFDGLLTPYLGLELDRLHGVGTVSQPESGDVWLLGVDAGLRFSYPVEPSLRLLLGGHLSVLPERARFHVEPNIELFRPERVGAEFGLGAELRLR